MQALQHKHNKIPRRLRGIGTTGSRKINLKRSEANSQKARNRSLPNSY
jgi:hypothetical protein